LKRIEYEFYLRVRCGEDRLIGVLPERRRKSERITHNSIMNWAKLLEPEYVLQERVYFVRVEIN
jgi:hypothetical protein